MYQGLVLNPAGGDEEEMKKEIPEFTFADANTELPSNLDWREYGEALSAALTLSPPRVINFKFLLQPHHKYYIRQYGELGFL